METPDGCNAASGNPDRRGHERGVAAVADASAGSLLAALSSPASRRPCAAACTVDKAVAGLLGYRREEEASRHTGPAGSGRYWRATGSGFRPVAHRSMSRGSASPPDILPEVVHLSGAGTGHRGSSRPASIS